MTTKTKHAERSHRSYHNQKPFADFERKAVVKKGQKEQSRTLWSSLKSVFHRTTNK